MKLTPREFKVGDRVQVRGERCNLNGRRMAGGTITRVHDDGTFDVLAGLAYLGMVTLSGVRRSSLVRIPA